MARLVQEGEFMVGETTKKNSVGQTLKFRLPVVLFDAHLRRAYEEFKGYGVDAESLVQRMEDVYEADEWIGAYPSEPEPKKIYQGGDPLLELFGYKPGDVLGNERGEQ